MHAAFAEYPSQPTVDRAEAQVAHASGVVLIQQPRDLGGRLIRREMQTVLGLRSNAIEHGA